MSYSELAGWFARFAIDHPDVYSAADLSKIWFWSHEEIERLGVETNAEKHRALVGLLRAGLLKRLRTAVSQCKKCLLHAYRLPGRPVLDDADWEADPFRFHDGEKAAPIGPVFAEAMIVSEGPGEFESRTGTPFVSFPVLVGSVCARACDSFEKCYPVPEKPKRSGQKKIYTPAAPCKVVNLRKAVLERVGISLQEDEEVLRIQTERANLKNWDIGTVAFYLDKALRKAGFWRAGWNGQARLWHGEKPRPPREPDIYICNLVKCRSCIPCPGASDGLKDDTPPQETVDACDPWLRLQIEIIQPKLIIALGNPAAAAILGKAVKITKVRGSFEKAPDGTAVLLEVHPSWISRMENAERQKVAFEGLISSFQQAREFLAGKNEPIAPIPMATAPEEEASPFADPTGDEVVELVTAALAKQMPNTSQITDEQMEKVLGKVEEAEEPLPEGPWDNPSEAEFISSFPDGEDNPFGAVPESAF